MDPHAVASLMVERSLELIRAKVSASELIAEIVRVAAREAPSDLWAEVASVDVRTDVSGVAGWIVRQTEGLPGEVTGLFLALDEVGPATSTSVEAVMQLIGGRGFPEENWLFTTDWFGNAYAPMPGLRSLLPMAHHYGPPFGWLVSYAVVFGYAMAVTAEVLDSVAGPLVLGSRDSLGIACGFHDGDIALLGVLNGDEFERTTETTWA